MASTYRQVGYGSTGSAVSKLQTVLNEHGYDLAVDGIFGEKTRAAVRDCTTFFRYHTNDELS